MVLVLGALNGKIPSLNPHHGEHNFIPRIKSTQTSMRPQGRSVGRTQQPWAPGLILTPWPWPQLGLREILCNHNWICSASSSACPVLEELQHLLQPLQETHQGLFGEGNGLDAAQLLFWWLRRGQGGLWL